MPEPQVVSWSEIDTFRQCPFKHQLAYKERWQKEPVDGSPLSRGSLFHSVLEEHYNGILHNDMEKAQNTIDSLLGANDEERTQDQELVDWIYRGYYAHYKLDGNWKIMAVEYANEFWLPTETGEQSEYKIKMKIDLIVKDPNQRIWIVDHKTCKNLPNDKLLELDDQFGLYTWGLRTLGMTVHGSIHNACRTYRYTSNKPQPLDERFKRTLMYRTDKELDRVAIEAYATAKRAWGPGPLEGDPERNPNTDTCNWRCDFTEPCLAGRKGVEIRGAGNLLQAQGFRQNFERH